MILVCAILDDKCTIDRNRKVGGVMIYVREDIPSKLLIKHVLPSDIECIFLELNFRKCKWFL